MTIKEMIAEQQAILDTARSAGRDLTPAETAQFDSLQRSIEAAGQGDPAAPNATGNATILERQRVHDIMELCRSVGMEPETYISDGSTMDAVRKAAIEHLIQRGRPVTTGMQADGGDTFRSAAVDALLLRSGVEVAQPAQEAESLRSLSIRDLAIECLVRAGEGTTTSLLRMNKDELFHTVSRQFFNPTAAFPAILDSAIKKTIVHMYQHTPTTFQLWTTKGSVTDFKPTKDHSYLAGGVGDFDLVGESGELKNSVPQTEMVPQRKVDTYGKQFSMTRQAFINDDIGFISEVPGIYSAAAKRTINKQVYQILVKNPAIYDGVALFDDAHGNLISTGGKPGIDTIQAMMLLLLDQTDPFGDSIMVQPKHIIVPVGYGFLVSQMLNTQVIDMDGVGSHTANALYAYRNQLSVVEDGTINALAKGGALPWFTVGDPMTAKSIQVDYLNGQEMPTIRRAEVPGRLGYTWDIFLDWGITVVDYRGIAKNVGVE